MMCFGFNKCGGALSVRVCQEVIEYHTARAEGILLVANLIVESHTDTPGYLGIWHRADVGPLKIDRTRDWLDPTDLYTHLFFNLVKGRGRCESNTTIAVRLFDKHTVEDPELEEQLTGGIIVPDPSREVFARYPIQDMLTQAGLSSPECSFVPFVYTEVGPFSGKGVCYAIRISAKIDDRSFGRLVPENPVVGIRYYQVYGVKEIVDRIEGLDLPDLDWNACPEVFSIYESVFKKRLFGSKLIPEFYSIVAIDAPDGRDYGPRRFYSVELQKGLKDLTSRIDDCLFEHRRLEQLRNRVFWFVTQNHSEDFMLWLEGPMAEQRQGRQMAEAH